MREAHRERAERLRRVNQLNRERRLLAGGLLADEFADDRGALGADVGVRVVAGVVAEGRKHVIGGSELAIVGEVVKRVHYLFADAGVLIARKGVEKHAADEILGPGVVERLKGFQADGGAGVLLHGVRERGVNVGKLAARREGVHGAEADVRREKIAVAEDVEQDVANVAIVHGALQSIGLLTIELQLNLRRRVRARRQQIDAGNGGVVEVESLDRRSQ